MDWNEFYSSISYDFRFAHNYSTYAYNYLTRARNFFAFAFFTFCQMQPNEKLFNTRIDIKKYVYSLHSLKYRFQLQKPSYIVINSS